MMKLNRMKRPMITISSVSAFSLSFISTSGFFCIKELLL